MIQPTFGNARSGASDARSRSFGSLAEVKIPNARH